MNHCKHDFVEDEMLVCMKCGYVTSDLMFSSSIPAQCEESYYHIDCHNNVIADVVFHFNLPSNLVLILSEKVNKDTRPLSKKEKLALHLYEQCVTDGICIRFHEICAVCGVNEKRIIRYGNNKSYFHAEDVVVKVCKLLMMKLEEIKVIQSKLQARPPTGFNPYTEVAAFIYHTYKHKFQMHEICKATNINPVSIRRYINKHIKQ